MIENGIIKHCAPVLAGLKSANMFNYKFLNIDELHMEMSKENKKLNEKGVYVDVLKINASSALVYVYRKKMLEDDLAREEVSLMLEKYGYSDGGLEYCLDRLKEKLRSYEVFPHEVGLFLGYPLQDVQGFIEQKGQNYLFCGIWKVYSNETEAKKLFRKYRKCTDIYQKLFEEGRSIKYLTIAA